jgi:acetyltransferase-like isoleucine patch superfamily enzyme
MSSPLIYPGATVCEGVTFGAGCVVGTHVYVGKRCQLGESVRIQHGAFLCNDMVIGDRVFIGPLVVCTDDRWPKVNNPQYHAEPPMLEDDCNIGGGAILLPGVRIGHHATVGAGAVVTNDVAPYTVVVGCPAREMEREVV